MAIEATWGGDSANCYIDLADATTFIEENSLYASIWTDATTEDQTAALLQATRDIDGLQFIGNRYYQGQQLECPRSLGATDWLSRVAIGETTSYADARLQRDVRAACCLQAVWLLRQKDQAAIIDHEASLLYGLQEVTKSSGPFMEKVRYLRQNPRNNALGIDALRLLQPWIQSKKVYRG